MKWIKGTWEGSTNIIFVNPEYITVVDTDRKLFWAQDCDVAVHYDEADYPLILKIAGLTEEALDNQMNTSTKIKEKK